VPPRARKRSPNGKTLDGGTSLAALLPRPPRTHQTGISPRSSVHLQFPQAQYRTRLLIGHTFTSPSWTSTPHGPDRIDSSSHDLLHVQCGEPFQLAHYVIAACPLPRGSQQRSQVIIPPFISVIFGTKEGFALGRFLVSSQACLRPRWRGSPPSGLTFVRPLMQVQTIILT
jgi:hypothetical protein